MTVIVPSGVLLEKTLPAPPAGGSGEDMQRSLRALSILGLLVAMTACGKKQEGGTQAPDAAEGSIAAGADAKNKASKDKAKTETLISQANADLSRGRYISARAKANDALAVNPNNADAYAVLGASYWRGGDFEASTKAYKEAIELDARNFGATLGLARNYQALGNHKEAIALADVVLKDDAKQIDPLLTKLWSYYALADADNAVKVMDDLFQFMGDNPLLPLVQANAAFMRPLEGKGELIKVEGQKGTSNVGLDMDGGLKYTGAEIGGTFAPLVFFELREECRIHKDLAKSLGLKPVGKMKPAGTDTELEIEIADGVKARVVRSTVGEVRAKGEPAKPGAAHIWTDACGSTASSLKPVRQRSLPLPTLYDGMISTVVFERIASNSSEIEAALTVRLGQKLPPHL